MFIIMEGGCCYKTAALFHVISHSLHIFEIDKSLFIM